MYQLYSNLPLGLGFYIAFNCDQDRFRTLIEEYDGFNPPFDDSISCFICEIVNGEESLHLGIIERINPTIECSYKNEKTGDDEDIDLKEYLGSTPGPPKDIVDLVMEEIDELTDEEIYEKYNMTRDEYIDKYMLFLALTYGRDEYETKDIALKSARFFFNLPRLISRGIFRIPFQLTPNCVFKYSFLRSYTDCEEMLSDDNIDFSKDGFSIEYDDYDDNRKLGFTLEYENNVYSFEVSIKLESLGDNQLTNFLKTIGMIVP